MRRGGGFYIGSAIEQAIGSHPLEMKQRIYLDHASTTPVLPVAKAAHSDGLGHWSNPNSAHSEGRRARALLEEARETLKSALGWRHDVIFTSGASESVLLAAECVLVPGRARTSTEHAVVNHAMGAEATVIPVADDGLVDEAVLDEVLQAGPALIAIQHVNNETGVIQPLDRLAERIRSAGSVLLADCAQSASKIALPDADLIAICAHKLGGPPGVGALLVRDLGLLKPCGGGQEKGYRRGTQDVPGAMAFAAALRARPYDMDRLGALRRRLEEGVQAAGGLIIARDSPRIPTIGAISLPGASSAALLVQLDLAGIAVSAGSACSSGRAQRSAVLAAMDVPPEIADGYLRISFGPRSDEAEIDAFLDEFGRIAERTAARAA